MDAPVFETRVLPREEWDRLQGTEAEGVGAMTAPGQAEVIVVERDGEIVACWVLVRIYHVECAWVAPAHRASPPVLKRLVSGMKRLARTKRVTRVISTAMTPEVEQLLIKLHGEEVPGRHFAIPV